MNLPSSKPTAGESCTYAAGREVILFWKEIGAFLIREGREIIFQPVPGAEEHLLRLFILGPVLAVILHQRGFLILHASAVEVNGNAVAFLGGSGWGKSTIAAALNGQGHAVLSDDVVAVDISGKVNPTLFPGFPQIKLNAEVVSVLSHLPANLPPPHSGLAKYLCPVNRQITQRPYRLHRLFVLSEGADQKVESTSRREAVMELISHSYCSRLLREGSQSRHFSQCANLANKVSIFRLRRRRSLSELSDLACLVEENLARNPFSDN
ncbi:MAG: serine kinase [Nitrospirae bacterium]|nr:serine kinase [Nitrospirota bacterium]